MLEVQGNQYLVNTPHLVLVSPYVHSEEYVTIPLPLILETNAISLWANTFPHWVCTTSIGNIMQAAARVNGSHLRVYGQQGLHLSISAF